MPCLAATSLTATPSARRQVPKVRRRSCELIRRKTSYGLSSSGAGSQRKNAITDAIARVAVMQSRRTISPLACRRRSRWSAGTAALALAHPALRACR